MLSLLNTNKTLCPKEPIIQPKSQYFIEQTLTFMTPNKCFPQLLTRSDTLLF